MMATFSHVNNEIDMLDDYINSRKVNSHRRAYHFALTTISFGFHCLKKQIKRAD